MNQKTSTIGRRSVLGGALALAAPWSRAQGTAAARPVRMLVGYAAGGGVDAVARMLSTRLPALLGQQVIVENRAGATGAIAADAVAKAAPDGTTLLVGETAMLLAPHLGTRLPFDPVASFTPAAGAFQVPLLLVANNEVPAATPKDFIALVRARPGHYSYATSGVGTVHHLGMEILKARTGAFILHIPYRGAAQIVPDVISGQVPFGVVSAAAGLAQAKAGRLRAVGLLSTAKLPGAEQVPALADALPGFDVAPRIFVLAPAGTPAPVVERLNDAIRTVLAGADLAQAAAQQGAVPAYLPPAALAAAMARESADWAAVIRQQKVTLE
ncbi:MAG TPA: tripartite tricarboxylate transporter substrate-binding protein [Ramlibacter sp.]|uniref:Bug family tripartite tricarboxylate transporter substrate binding protein n=1 Tax=Ramlibacter sp. TaxID=1917967 RepID=UPI002D6C3430|nr:tripartite tricarboxylate transporter substrate-binding protein [Ramlibacter sp.]HZY17882.1 tripartite tricarboxylate transporter substrate-binding protein [Ramlibacter sp.]